jgi:DNA polymerase III sliding clamp (beta) subunit (PCNA family)
MSSCEIEKDLLLLKLQQVGAAVSSRDLMPILTFVNIAQGYLSGYDGRHAIRMRVPQLEGLEANVKYDKLLRAAQAAEGTVKLAMRDKKLSVTSGRFRAQISVTPELFPYKLEEGEGTQWEPVAEDSLIDILRALLPFVSTNMSRPWQNGVWLNGTHAYATDNTVLARAKCVWPLTPITIPRDICQELVSLNPAVTMVAAVGGRTLFDCDSYVMDVQCLSDRFPESVVKMLDDAEALGIDEKAPDGLKDAVQKVTAFVGDDKFPAVYLGKQGVWTEGREDKAQVVGFELPECLFNPLILAPVLEVSTHINLSQFPRCPFRGHRLTGMIAGMRT